MNLCDWPIMMILIIFHGTFLLPSLGWDVVRSSGEQEASKIVNYCVDNIFIVISRKNNFGNQQEHEL